MSVGDQLNTEFVGLVGNFFGAIITSFFATVVTPFMTLVAGWFGL